MAGSRPGPKKGAINNPKGRPKGVPNKVTADIRETIKSFLDKNLPNIQKTFNKLEPKEQLVFLEKLLPYVVPKLQSTELTGEIKTLTDDQVDALFDRLVN